MPMHHSLLGIKGPFGALLSVLMFGLCRMAAVHYCLVRDLNSLLLWFMSWHASTSSPALLQLCGIHQTHQTVQWGSTMIRSRGCFSQKGLKLCNSQLPRTHLCVFNCLTRVQQH